MPRPCRMVALPRFHQAPARRLCLRLSLGSCLLLQTTQAWGQGSANANSPNPRVLRSLQIQQLPAGTFNNLGGYQLNLDGVRRFSAAITAQAQAIRQLGSMAKVLNEQATVSELDTGLLINTALTYSVQLGACLKQETTLARAGIRCRKPVQLEQSIAALSNPRSERYIQDPSQRQQAINKLKQARQDALQMAAQARSQLNQQELLQKLGGETVNALKGLNDEQLANELFNAGERSLEQAIFVPSTDNLLKFKTINNLRPNNLRPLQQSQVPHDDNLIASTNLQQLLLAANSPGGSSRQDTFLTGFTLGKHYEWKKRFSVTVYRCLIGCKATYYLEPYAKFGYGLGLRFPIRSALTYTSTGDGRSATVSAKFDPFDASPSDYTATGLRGDQLFEGQELVAELSAEAGFRYKVPLDSGNVSFSLGRDLTDKLPRPFAGGNFTPPSPQRPLSGVAPIFLEDIDLLFGNVNYGVVWAKLHPGIKADLSSEELSFKLVDNYANASSQTISSGQRRTVTARNGQSSITLKDPKYNLSFTLTPGMKYKVGVDLLVWDDSFSDSIWLPQLSVTLPPRGAEFSCHSGTRCSQNYIFSASRNGQGGGSPDSTPAPNSNPRPTPGNPPSQQRLDGWWRGDRSGLYSIQTSGSNFQMKGHTNQGIPFNLFTGTINGDTISGSWKNLCNDRTGNAVLSFSNGLLTRTSGSTSNSSWSRSSRPANLQANPSCSTAPAPNPNPRPNPGNPPQSGWNLSGTWRANDGGTYTIYQSGNALSWQGQGGNFKNTFTGQIQGNIITGYWQDTAGSQTKNSGRIKLRIVNNVHLERVSHTGAFAGSMWTRW